jgi:hypothetical protein
MTPVFANVGLLSAADDNGICESQTPVAGPLTLDGALVTTVTTGNTYDGTPITVTSAVLDQPRRIVITTTDDETANNFTITGYGRGGTPISEILAGVDTGTMTTAQDFAVVTGVSISGNAVAAVYVGTSATASSNWVRLDSWALNPVAIQTTVSGTVTYTLQTTLDDPNSLSNPVTPAQCVWFNSTDTNVVNASASKQSTFGNAPTFARITVTAGDGAVTGTFVQYSSVPY